MKILESWEVWVLIYLISAIIFAQSFRVSKRQMKNVGQMTVLLELFTAFFALFFLPFFKFIFPTDLTIYGTLFLVTIIYAVTDRLNIEARYGLEPSTFSMLKQLSTVFMIIFGLLFFKEEFVFNKIIGAILIVFANLLLAFEKGKFQLNKYFLISVISNLLFAIAMMINVNISDSFNLAFYTILTVSLPALFISIFGRYSFQSLQEEFRTYDKKYFLLSSFTWCLMLLSSVRAYQLGSVIVIAPLFALTSILNAVVEYFINPNGNKFLKKMVAAIIIIIGVLLVKS